MAKHVFEMLDVKNTCSLPVSAIHEPSADWIDTKMAVIFLDIDGVLNRASRKAHSNDHVIAVDLLRRLKSLVSSTKAFVVLASTWRHEPGGVQKARENRNSV